MRGYSCIGLDNPKTPINIGSTIRACGNFDAAFLAIRGTRYRKSCTDTMKHHRHMPVFQVEDLKTMIPYDCVPVAVDLVPEAECLINYTHPKRAFYIFGAEDATLGDRVLSWCREVIYIPTNHCMNLAATVHVVLYDRMVKEAIPKHE